MDGMSMTHSLRRLRREAGLTQFQLAVKSGLTLTTVSLAERTGYFSSTTAERLAAALNVTVDSLSPTDRTPGAPPAQLLRRVK